MSSGECRLKSSQMVRAFVAPFITLFIFGFADVSAVSRKPCSLQETPLPKDLSIEPLADSVSPDMAQFHGIWSNGRWGVEAPCTTLVVTKIVANGDAEVIYSIGKVSGSKPRYRKKRAEIRGGKLSFWHSRTKLEYRLGEDGTIRGVKQNPWTGKWKVILTKIYAP